MIESTIAVKQFSGLLLNQTSLLPNRRVFDWGGERQKRQLNDLFVYFLPTYSPTLNLIEILWKRIKHHWLPIEAFQSFNSLYHHIQNILVNYGSKIPLPFYLIIYYTNSVSLQYIFEGDRNEVDSGCIGSE